MDNDIESLVIEMAENRAEFRRVQGEINAFYMESDELSITMQEIHDNWYSDRDCYGFSSRWSGWVSAFDVYDGSDEHGDVRVARKLCILLDKRTELKRDLGRIRRALCAKGRALLGKNRLDG